MSAAVILYTGIGLELAPWPVPDNSGRRLAARFGAADGAELALIVDRLSTEFYEVVPTDTETLIESADRAAARFTARHPELSAEAVHALRWCYTYDWK